MKRTVRVIQEVEVENDETKFTPQFMQEFRESFFDFGTIEQHIEHLAQLEARSIYGEFIEGYGKRSDMGISMKVKDFETELV